jgi:hypothetical protein
MACGDLCGSIVGCRVDDDQLVNQSRVAPRADGAIVDGGDRSRALLGRHDHRHTRLRGLAPDQVQERELLGAVPARRHPSRHGEINRGHRFHEPTATPLATREAHEPPGEQLGRNLIEPPSELHIAGRPLE